MLHNADHTYAWRGQDGEVIVDPVDVEVQTDPDDCNAPRKEASTLKNTTSQWTLSSEAEQEGAFRKAFIRSILASDTAVKKFTDTDLASTFTGSQPLNPFPILLSGECGDTDTDLASTFTGSQPLNPFPILLSGECGDTDTDLASTFTGSQPLNSFPIFFPKDNIRKILKASQPTTLYGMLRKALAGLRSSGA
ncbi:hypothetical protein Pmani_021175 [Petrolisthes manimaculis]|uniref:Uncharacterized protein n=1 Tax=Petrolisthes manimaculis TaxID=1843537 RepID=A0AAE1PGT8_9EUCA|nr:hypothetical protein Pmani_021175 [Petrolisthes manimaculis]